MSTDTIMSALGAGSGIDIKGLARNLADVEQKPREEAIQARIDKTEKRISGYGAVMFGLKQLKDAFAALNDRSEFTGASAKNSTPLAYEATAGASASLGQHSVEVTGLASGRVVRSGNFSAANTTLNSGVAFSLEITRGSSTTAVDVTRKSPEGVVEAINSKTETTGVEARLVNTGDPANPVTIVLTGESGAANHFTISQPAGQAVAGLEFATQIKPATDATAIIDGIAVQRPTNTIDDVIPGVKLELLGQSNSPGTVTISRDTAPVREKIDTLVKAYNDLQDFLDTMADPKSEDEEYGGILANDSLVRYVRDQARSMMTATSSTPGGTVSAMRDIGITLDREGRLQIDAAKLDVALIGRFDEIAKAFTANTDNQSMLGDAARGLAGDAVKRLDDLMGASGPIMARNNAANTQLDRAELDMTRLKEQMEEVYERYLDQFIVMDGLVSQMNSLRESLKGQFENLAAMYNNK
ncbi:MAG: Flagellar hook-associated protein 2 [Pseudomonadota bacterium]